MSSKEEISYQAKKKEKDSGESDKFRKKMSSFVESIFGKKKKNLNSKKLSKLVKELLNERRFMVSLIESHMKKRIGIKK